MIHDDEINHGLFLNDFSNSIMPLTLNRIVGFAYDATAGVYKNAMTSKNGMLNLGICKISWGTADANYASFQSCKLLNRYSFS
jgi:hypothetical protein